MKPKYLTGPLAGFSALLLCMACEPSVTVHHLNNNEARLHFAANRDYLLLPVEDGAPNATLRFFTEDGGSPWRARRATAPFRSTCAPTTAGK